MLKIKKVLQKRNDKKETILRDNNIDTNDKRENKKVATACAIINVRAD